MINLLDFFLTSVSMVLMLVNYSTKLYQPVNLYIWHYSLYGSYALSTVPTVVSLVTRKRKIQEILKKMSIGIKGITVLVSMMPFYVFKGVKKMKEKYSVRSKFYFLFLKYELIFVFSIGVLITMLAVVFIVGVVYLRYLERIKKQRERVMTEFYKMIDKRKDDLNYMIQTNPRFFFQGGFLDVELEKLSQVSEWLKEEEMRRRDAEGMGVSGVRIRVRTLLREEDEGEEEKEEAEERNNERTDIRGALIQPLLQQEELSLNLSHESISNSFSNDDCRYCRHPLLSTEPSIQRDTNGIEILIPPNTLVLPCCFSYVHQDCAKIALSISPVCDCEGNVRIALLLCLIKRAKRGRGVVIEKKSEKIEKLRGDVDTPCIEDCIGWD